MLTPAGRLVYDARCGETIDSREELQRKVFLADAVLAQVAELASREPAAVATLVSALDKTIAASKALSVHDLRSREADTPKRLEINVNVHEIS